MRLDKFLSHSGFGSRKEVKILLKKKQVQVNNLVQTKGDFKLSTKKDYVTVSDKPVFYQKYIYLLLNKPQDVLSATEDSKQRTVIDLLDESYSHYELFPVGRLDKDTEGLLLLTNDGELAHFLLSPKRQVEKTYFAQVKGVMEADDQEAFSQGVVLEDETTCLPATLEILKIDEVKNGSEVLITIKEGKFHQVKRMVASRGKEVVFLKRLSMGTLKLDERLQPGEYRLLSEIELANLQTFLPQES